MTTVPPLPPLPLPDGVSSQFVDCPSVKLNFHYLESVRPTIDTNGNNLILLLHGYPDLAFSWRKVIQLLAKATSNQYHIVAPDLRGYGRTRGWDNSEWSQTNLHEFTETSLTRDIVTFVRALGYSKVNTVVGHDFGAAAASSCALIRPDVFSRLVLMSHPYNANPDVPEASTAHDCAQQSKPVKPDINAELAALPQPKTHYRVYNSTERAATDWLTPPQGLAAYLRGYFHIKSADWARNKPHPLREFSGAEMAKMPEYYIMPRGSTFPEVVTNLMKGEDPSATESWLSDSDLDVYVQEWQRTGFQGGLNWYRAKTQPGLSSDMFLFAGRKMQVPTIFISGAQDWGNYQTPGALESMSSTCELFKGVILIERAGHWIQGEQPQRVAEEILKFIDS